MQETQVRSLGQKDLLGGNGDPLQLFCLKNPYGQRTLVGYTA